MVALMECSALLAKGSTMVSLGRHGLRLEAGSVRLAEMS